MNNFYSIENIDIIDIEASEEIEKKSLKDFISTSLKLKNINLTKDSKVVLNYIKELKIYQLLLFQNVSTNLEIELFFELIKDNQKEFISFIYKKYFLIFKNNKIYYIQKIDETLNYIEFLEYLNKLFKINNESFITINQEELHKNNISKQSKVEYFNLKNDNSFYFYILYISTIIFISIFFYINNIEENSNKEVIIDTKIVENSYKFNSFEQEAKKLFLNLEKYNLSIVSLNFEEDILKMEIFSLTKDEIHNFLEDKNFVFIESSIDFIENQNLYKAIIDVKIFK